MSDPAVGSETGSLRFDGVVFDLDGTLADTLEDLAAAVNRMLATEGLPPHGDAAYRQMIGKGIRNLVTVALPREQRTEETVDRCFARMIADYREHCLVKTRLYGGIAELLGELRAGGVKLAVFSNKADDLTRRIVEALTDPGTFDIIVGARPGLPLKPDPAAALLISARLGIAPSRWVYLGDSGTDMLTATAAGMVAVGVLWGFRTRDELVENGATVVLDHPLELLALRAASGR